MSKEIRVLMGDLASGPAGRASLPRYEVSMVDQRKSSSLVDLFLFFLNLDAQGFQKFQVLIAHFEFGVGA